jgi:hypothetical protein
LNGRRRCIAACIVTVCIGGMAVTALPLRADDQATADQAGAAYPKPSPFPIAWELTFTHSDPKRIVVTLPGDREPSAYWYMTYSVVNNADQSGTFNPDKDKERIFYPEFTMRTSDGKLIPANDGIHPAVLDAIKLQERNKYMEDPTQMGGRILLGADQQRDSVAIWAEPSQRMGSFTIFVSGLWGETAEAKDSQGNVLKDPKGQSIILHKTLMLDYHVDGDATHFSPVRNTGEEFIMR